MTTYADSAYHGVGSTIRAPYRKVRLDRATGKFTSRHLSAGMRAVNTSIAQLRAPGERANAELKNWRILRKIRSSPSAATLLVDAVQTLILKA